MNTNAINIESDIIIVGSGAGGATLAKDLAASGKSIIIIEKGLKPEPLGRVSTAMRVYDGSGLDFKNRSKEGNLYYRAICCGGTTVVNLGNAVRLYDESFLNLDIELTEEFEEAEKELNVAPAQHNVIGIGSQKISEAAEKLGYKMKPMPKCLKQKKCTSCGSCILGCMYGARWSALDFLYVALKKGVRLYANTEVQKVITEHGITKGVEAKTRFFGKKYIFHAKIVILAAGALSTPLILMNSDVKTDVGQGLFFDFFPVVYGIHKKFGMAKEIPMVLFNDQFYKSDGLLLSPYIDLPILLARNSPRKIDAFRTNKMLGILIKTKDEPIGTVYKNGVITKPITDSDQKRFKKGITIAKEILLKTGVPPNAILQMPIRGAHPGGTAAIGRVLDKNLQTEVKNLFVCDASVFPKSIGAPPILTIVALAKRLSNHLLREL